MCTEKTQKAEQTHFDYYFEIEDLKQYVKQQYKDKFGKEISDIGLHKTLYFLFAYWGGFIKQGKDNQIVWKKIC